VVAASDDRQAAALLQAPLPPDLHPQDGEVTAPSCAEVAAARAAVETAVLD